MRQIRTISKEDNGRPATLLVYKKKGERAKDLQWVAIRRCALTENAQPAVTLLCAAAAR